MKNVLIVAPHADDAEIGCGGTISRLLRSGSRVTVAVLCDVPKVVPVGMSLDHWKREQLKSAKSMGFELVTCNYEIRRFSEHRQDILETLTRMKLEIDPDCVFIPSTFDIHQDHKCISEEGVRAFKDRKLLGYELFWNHIGLHQTQTYFRLSSKDIANKIKAISIFKTQTWRPFCDPTITAGHARCRGIQINTKYAEAFEVIRWVI